MAGSNSVMTVIVPIRSDNFDFYAERLRLRDNCDLWNIETLIVDDGSDADVGANLKRFCGEREWGYIRLETNEEPFSLARARNAGIDHSKTEWIFLDDADMTYPKSFFRDILKELLVLDQSPFNFLTIPAVYLSGPATEEVWKTQEIDSHIPRFLMRLMLEDPRGSDRNEDIQHYAPASAILAMRTKTAQSVGAYDAEFVGWGGEDRDFVYRLLFANKNVPKPPAFDATKQWNMNDTHVFEGWRSLYRLHGDYMARKGFYAFHPFHENNDWRGPNAINNVQLAAEKAKFYATKGKIGTRPATNIAEDIIIGFNPFLVDDRIRQTLTNPSIVDENIQTPPRMFVEEILERKPSSILVWNPYGSDWRLKVYKEFLTRGVTPIVGERGALPDSIYFDKGGLCIESDHYQERYWLKELTVDQRQGAIKYINDIRFGDGALEKQAGRIGTWRLRQKLGIPDGKKILFAPLQLYDDTVTKFFSEKGRGYQEYIDELTRLSFSLPADWVFVYKNHPLTLKKTPFSSGVCADDCHINDLLEASEAVTVFNSGTGLLAMAFEKPVLYYGPCFYAIEGINWKFEDVGSALSLLRNLPKVDNEKTIAFYYYLSHEFYSFAEIESTTAKQTNLSMRTKMSEIKYQIIRIPGFTEKTYQKNSFDIYPSVLFDTYRLHAINSRTSSKKAPAPIAKKATKTSPKDAAPQIPKAPVAAKSTPEKKGTKIAKLRRNPYAFFHDSKSPLARPIRHFFRKRA
ncbi:MAG: glycosyltransferase [Phyllobacterium sp.]